MKSAAYADLSETHQKAISAAEAALKHSYSPYSGFAVGAALISINQEIIVGTNFENAAYGSTICAERAAVLQANSMGIRNFTGIALIARGQGLIDVAAPCGSCRQVLYEAAELSGGDIEVILSDSTKQKVVLTSIRELLPLAFGPTVLGVNIAKYRE